MECIRTLIERLKLVANSRRDGRKSRLPRRSEWQRDSTNGIRHDWDVHQMLNSGDEEISDYGSIYRARAFDSLTAACRENPG